MFYSYAINSLLNGLPIYAKCQVDWNIFFLLHILSRQQFDGRYSFHLSIWVDHQCIYLVSPDLSFLGLTISNYYLFTLHLTYLHNRLGFFWLLPLYWLMGGVIHIYSMRSNFKTTLFLNMNKWSKLHNTLLFKIYFNLNIDSTVRDFFRLVSILVIKFSTSRLSLTLHSERRFSILIISVISPGFILSPSSP